MSPHSSTGTPATLTPPMCSASALSSETRSAGGKLGWEEHRDSPAELNCAELSSPPACPPSCLSQCSQHQLSTSPAPTLLQSCTNPALRTHHHLLPCTQPQLCSFSLSLDVSVPSPPGTHWHLQAAVRDPGGCKEGQCWDRVKHPGEGWGQAAH